MLFRTWFQYKTIHIVGGLLYPVLSANAKLDNVWALQGFGGRQYITVFQFPWPLLQFFYSETMSPPLSSVRYRISDFVVRLRVQTVFCDLASGEHSHVPAVKILRVILLLLSLTHAFDGIRTMGHEYQLRAANVPTKTFKTMKAAKVYLKHTRGTSGCNDECSQGHAV